MSTLFATPAAAVDQRAPGKDAPNVSELVIPSKAWMKRMDQQCLRRNLIILAKIAAERMRQDGRGFSQRSHVATLEDVQDETGEPVGIAGIWINHDAYISKQAPAAALEITRESPPGRSTVSKDLVVSYPQTGEFAHAAGAAARYILELFKSGGERFYEELYSAGARHLAHMMRLDELG